MRFAILLIGLLLAISPVPSAAQCSDQLCRNLQNILDAADIDFRDYQARGAGGPDASMEDTKVPCQMSRWANNVPMYTCYAQVPFANGARWYQRTMHSLKSLMPSSWQFQIQSPGDDHYADAGPPDCEITPTEGP